MTLSNSQASSIYSESKRIDCDHNMNQKNLEYIKKGYIELGMTKDEVRASWGQPKTIKHKKTKDYDEIWVYVPNWKFKNQLFFRGLELLLILSLQESSWGSGCLDSLLQAEEISLRLLMFFFFS